MSATEPTKETPRPSGFGPGVSKRVEEVTTQFEDDLITDENGKPAEFSITYRVLPSQDMIAVGKTLEKAGAGLTGKVREQAKRRAFFDAFETLVVRAGNYAGAEGLSRSELRDYFEGKRMPEGTPEADRLFWTERYENHAVSTITGFIEGLKIRPTFRG